MKPIIEGCFTRPGAVILALMLPFQVLVLFCYTQGSLTDVEIPVDVSVAYEGISPSDAEKLLTKPLEKQLRRLPA